MKSLFPRPYLGANGCGPKGWRIPGGNLANSSACNDHDDAFTLGGDGAKLLQAQDDFVSDLKINVGMQPLLLQPLYQLDGAIKATVTGLFGWAFFNWRKKPAPTKTTKGE